LKKGDIVVFNLTHGTYEGKIVKVYDSDYIKVRYRMYGFIPVYRIDRLSRMLSHKPN
jgi:hypothetical protein